MSEVIDLINASDASDDQKQALGTAFKTYKTESNDSSKLARIKLENERDTALQSVENFKGLNLDLQNQVDNAGANDENIEAKLKEAQTQSDLKYNALQGKYDGVITENNKFVSDKKVDGLNKYATTLLGGAVDFPNANELFAKGLYETKTEGTYLAKDSDGAEILPEKHRENFIKTYSKYVPAPGANIGGSDTQTTNTTGNIDDKKPAPIKDLIPVEFK